MSVDYWLFRASAKQEMDGTEELPFGSQEENIERLCSTSGFELRSKEPLANIGSRATITYTYRQKNDMGRDVEFALQGDPVACISTNRSYREDFLPVIAILLDLSPFEIGDLDGDIVSPEKLFYSLDDWMQKNYQEEVLSFNYEGY
ncbi:MAG: hypothetical protein RBJ76_06705 [Stenomitos frigidus ULC029]